MKGNNILFLCEAEMKKAIQYYFDNVVFREESVSIVNSIGMETQQGCNVFNIGLVEYEEE